MSSPLVISQTAKRKNWSVCPLEAWDRQDSGSFRKSLEHKGVVNLGTHSFSRLFGQSKKILTGYFSGYIPEHLRAFCVGSNQCPDS